MAGDAITTPAHSRSLSLLWSSGGLPCLPVEGAAFGEPSQRLDQPPRGPDRIAAVPMIRLGWVISKLVVHVWLRWDTFEFMASLHPICLGFPAAQILVWCGCWGAWITRVGGFPWFSPRLGLRHSPLSANQQSGRRSFLADKSTGGL